MDATAQSAPKGRKESRALSDEMDVTAQSALKGRKASKVSKASKAFQVSKAHRASKAFQDLPALKGNPVLFCRRVSHHSVQHFLRLAETEGVRSRDREVRLH